MNNKKQLLLSIGLVLILVLMIVGISYAAFKFVGLGNKPNTITTGAITMEYEESTNTISMTGALPTTDATGKVRLTAGEYFDFTIKSSIQGNANINWEIAAEDITASSAKKMDGKNIKLYLTKLDSTGAETQVMAPKVYNASTSANTKTGRPSGVMSLATGTMSASETTNYRLRMYVDESYNPQGDGGGLSFSVKINAYGKVKQAPTGSKMKAYVTQTDYDNGNFSPQTDFHTNDYRSKITSITTKKDNIVPATAVESWDISEAQDGSVMAYVEDDGTGNGTYKVTIGGKGGIIANESMVYYFGGFDKMTSIDLSALDTSEVTDMRSMFSICMSLTKLDLTNFDTSKVTNMSGMFGGGDDFPMDIEEINMSNFNTSQVTDMSYMFSGCSSLTNLDVSNFDTSNVTDMSYMFSYCDSLTNLNVSNFNTVNVTNMSEIFRNCSRLTSLDLSNFDTSKVTNMSDMFSNCACLTSLDVSNFNTSKVTSMGNMFFNCSSLTNLNVSNFNTSKVTSMGSMFGSCRRLTSLDLSNFDTSKVTDMLAMFDGCSGLTELNLSTWNTSNVTYMNNFLDGMFYGCSNLTSLDLRSFDTSKITDFDFMFKDCSKLTEITVSNKWVVGTSASTDSMFNNCGTDHVTVV